MAHHARDRVDGVTFRHELASWRPVGRFSAARSPSGDDRRWAVHLDFSTLAPVPADFVARYLKKYEADIIWRVRYGGKGDWFFVFVLMELQSSVPRFMALRLLGYVLHCARLCSSTGSTSRRVVPAVFFPRCWRWCCTMGRSRGRLRCPWPELFKPMEGYTPPDFRYVVLDVNRYPPDELRPVEDVTSGVFLMEQSKDVAELELVLDELEEVVDDPALARDIASLVSDVAIKLELDEEEVPRVKSLEEVRMSLLQRAERWTQEWKAEGLAEGRAEGLAEGRAEGRTEGRTEGRRLGMAETLKNLVERRFGDLPDWAVDRIDRADVGSLERWSYRIMDATTLEGVLRDDESAQE